MPMVPLSDRHAVGGSHEYPGEQAGQDSNLHLPGNNRVFYRLNYSPSFYLLWRRVDSNRHIPFLRRTTLPLAYSAICHPDTPAKIRTWKPTILSGGGIPIPVTGAYCFCHNTFSFENDNSGIETVDFPACDRYDLHSCDPREASMTCLASRLSHMSHTLPSDPRQLVSSTMLMDDKWSSFGTLHCRVLDCLHFQPLVLAPSFDP